MTSALFRDTRDKEKAPGRQRQRLEWCSCKRRCSWSPRKLEEAREDLSPGRTVTVPQLASRLLDRSKFVMF